MAQVTISDIGVLISDIIADLGRTTTDNGDRCSDYFRLVENSNGGRVSVSVIENKADLPEQDWYYSIHVVDDITESDCYLLHTDTLNSSELELLLQHTAQKFI